MLSRLTHRGRRHAFGAALATAFVLVAGCEGPNRFSGVGPLDARGGSEPSVTIQVPRGDSLTARPLGDSILIRARVTDDLGIDSVRMYGLALRGDPGLGTDTVVVRYEPKSVLLQAQRDTVISRYLTAVPDSTRETVHVVAEAFDVEGLFAADTVTVIVGGPRVELLNLTPGQFVQAGLSLGLQLEASDPQGILTTEFRISGAFADTIRRSFNPALDSVRMDTTVVIPSGLTGNIEVLAVARNSLDISGLDGPIGLVVVSAGALDETPPGVNMEVNSPDRLEVGDSVRVTVMGQDDPQGSGVARAGVTVTAVAPGRGTSETRSLTRDFVPPRTGPINETFTFAPFNVDPTQLPDTLVFEITAYLVDASGNCSATVLNGGEPQMLPCVVGAGGAIQAETSSGFPYTRTIVAGTTVALPAGGGRILDAVIDPVRRNLMLSNQSAGRVEVFRLQTEQFLPAIGVGSLPWGLTLNRSGDTLLVANSGGTNISSVFLGPASGLGPMTEIEPARFLTPDVLLFDTERVLDGTGEVRYNVFVVPQPQSPSFSDRPQFLVQDFTGRLLYSTATTLIGDFGTIRKAFVPPGGVAPEVLMFWEHGAMLPEQDWVGVANADAVWAVRAADGDLIQVRDHVPGFPDQLIITPAVPGPDSAVNLARLQGSDAVAIPGRFSVPNMGFTDTTFVAASGDRRWAVFGEGVAEVGRIIMYDASLDAISSVIQVSDLFINASESVRGVGLNQDGTMGVARGDGDASFFTTDLRLQGTAPLPAGGAGAALHPLHANSRSLDNPGIYEPNTHLAFFGTGERTIDVIDTQRFSRVGRIFIRDVISGPLRATLPFPEDNAGLQCASVGVFDRFGNNVGQAVEIFQGGDFSSPHPPAGATNDLCVVLKLFGVTDTGGVVVIDVRKADVLRNHPARF